MNLKESWMVGDRDSDIGCGRAAGTRTILIDNPDSAKNRSGGKQDYMARDLVEAKDIIIRTADSSFIGRDGTMPTFKDIQPKIKYFPTGRSEGDSQNRRRGH